MVGWFKQWFWVTDYQLLPILSVAAVSASFCRCWGHEMRIKSQHSPERDESSPWCWRTLGRNGHEPVETGSTVQLNELTGVAHLFWWLPCRSQWLVLTQAAENLENIQGSGVDCWLLGGANQWELGAATWPRCMVEFCTFRWPNYESKFGDPLLSASCLLC